MKREIKKDCVYKHFKGRLYWVADIVPDATNGSNDTYVYYKAITGSKTYVRKLEEFASEVDHKKYPHINQKYIFEEFRGA